MEEITCKDCNFLNDPNSLYCQKCGKLLERKGLKSIIKSFNFDTIAGLGQKGVSIAPLVGMQKESSLSKNNLKSVKKSYSLKDGSWYCPYCGDKNKPNTYECHNCLKSKP